jgi:hypothetical protein
VAAAGQWIADRGRDFDGLVRGTTGTVERGLSAARHAAGDAAQQLVRTAVSPLASNPATRPLATNIVRQADQVVNTAVAAGDATTRFVGGAVNGLSGVISGPIGLVGSGLQLADPQVRADTQRSIDALRANPAAAAVAVRDAAVQGFQRDPAGLLGEVVGNLVPVGAVANGLGKLGKVGQLADVAADTSRTIDAAADASRVVRTTTAASDTARSAAASARVASSTPVRPGALPLLSTDEYRVLVARQAQQGQIPLDGIARPGIVNVGPDGVAAVVQGAGRFEKARAGEQLDVFVPRGAPLPAGSVVLDADVPTDTVRLANRLSSRGEAGANPDLVDFTTTDFATGAPREYQRVLVPVEQLVAPTSKMGHLVRSGEAELAKQLGGADAAARMLDGQPGWRGGSLVDRFEVLKRLGVARAEDLQ